MKIGNNKNMNFNKPSGNIDKSIIEEIDKKVDDKIQEFTEIVDDLEKIEISDEEPTDENVVIWVNTAQDAVADIMLRINDETIASNTVWSSEKVNEQIQNTVFDANAHVHDNKEAIDKITTKDIDKWNNKSEFSGSYNDLTNKPLIPSINGLATEKYVDEAIEEVVDNIIIPELDLSDYATKSEIPTKVSELENDMSYAKDTDLHDHDNKSVLDGITIAQIERWNSNTNFDGDYNSLTSKPEIPSIDGLASEIYVDTMIENIFIPTRISELQNDRGYLTEIPSEYITEEELDEKGYITEHQSLEGYATEEYVSSQINESIDKIDTTVCSDTEPTDENVVLWVNTAQDENTESVARINDDTVANNTTWSSNKVNEIIGSLSLVREGNTIKLMLGDIELSNISIE